MKTLAIVLSQTLQGENNKILTLLTPKAQITAICYHANKLDNNLRPLCELFVYGSYELTRSKGGMYVLKSGEIIENFYDLRLDYEKLESACYIVKLAKEQILVDIKENYQGLRF